MSLKESQLVKRKRDSTTLDKEEDSYLPPNKRYSKDQLLLGEPECAELLSDDSFDESRLLTWKFSNTKDCKTVSEGINLMEVAGYLKNLYTSHYTTIIRKLGRIVGSRICQAISRGIFEFIKNIVHRYFPRNGLANFLPENLDNLKGISAVSDAILSSIPGHSAREKVFSFFKKYMELFIDHAKLRTVIESKWDPKVDFFETHLRTLLHKALIILSFTEFIKPKCKFVFEPPGTVVTNDTHNFTYRGGDDDEEERTSYFLVAVNFPALYVGEERFQKVANVEVSDSEPEGATLQSLLREISFFQLFAAQAEHFFFYSFSFQNKLWRRHFKDIIHFDIDRLHNLLEDSTLDAKYNREDSGSDPETVTNPLAPLLPVTDPPTPNPPVIEEPPNHIVKTLETPKPISVTPGGPDTPISSTHTPGGPDTPIPSTHTPGGPDTPTPYPPTHTPGGPDTPNPFTVTTPDPPNPPVALKSSLNHSNSTTLAAETPGQPDNFDTPQPTPDPPKEHVREIIIEENVITNTGDSQNSETSLKAGGGINCIGGEANTPIVVAKPNETKKDSEESSSDEVSSSSSTETGKKESPASRKEETSESTKETAEESNQKDQIESTKFETVAKETPGGSPAPLESNSGKIQTDDKQNKISKSSDVSSSGSSYKKVKVTGQTEGVRELNGTSLPSDKKDVVEQAAAVPLKQEEGGTSKDEYPEHLLSGKPIESNEAEIELGSLSRAIPTPTGEEMSPRPGKRERVSSVAKPNDEGEGDSKDKRKKKKSHRSCCRFTR